MSEDGDRGYRDDTSMDSRNPFRVLPLFDLAESEEGGDQGEQLGDVEGNSATFFSEFPSCIPAKCAFVVVVTCECVCVCEHGCGCVHV